MSVNTVKDGVHWVGAVDWNMRDFHGYETPHGTSYNNYLIVDDDITLVDTVKYDFADATIDNIRSIVDPAKIKNVIINHIENDHVTSLDKVMQYTPSASIYITERGKNGLARFFDISKWDINVVKTGDTLSIGQRTLMFVETPMIHWPDSMMTYIKEDKVLFSQDAFGQHIATNMLFDDEFIGCASMSELEDAVIDYYANILMPFGQLIKTKISELEKLGVEPEIVAPDHGVIWRENIDKVKNMYLNMVNGKAELSIVIVYDTMWHSTEKLALHVMQGIIYEGVVCKLIKLRTTPMSVAVKELWKSRGVLIGTPTLNNQIFTSVAAFLAYIRGLKPKNRIAGAFGSYGWGGGAVKGVYEELNRIGLEVFEPGLQVQFRPQLDDVDKCREFGRQFAQKVKEFHRGF